MATEQERNRGLGAYSTPGVDTPGAGAAFESAAASPLTKFKFVNVDPPSRIYMTERDFLSFSIRTMLVGVTVVIRTRILRLDGTITYSEDSFSPTSDGSSNVFFIRVTEGYLLGIECSQSTGPSPLRGQIYVQGLFSTGTFTVTKSFQPLFAGYLLPSNFLGFPGTSLISAVEGPGAWRSVVGTTPAAGAEITETVPTNRRWRLKTIVFAFTTGAAVANREPMLLISDGVNSLMRVPSGFSQAASLARNYDWSLGTSRFDGAVWVQTVAPLADMILGAGYKISTATQNLQAADQYAAPQYEVEEWIEC